MCQYLRKLSLDKLHSVQHDAGVRSERVHAAPEKIKSGCLLCAGMREQSASQVEPGRCKVRPYLGHGRCNSDASAASFPQARN